MTPSCVGTTGTLAASRGASRIRLAGDGSVVAAVRASARRAAIDAGPWWHLPPSKAGRNPAWRFDMRALVRLPCGAGSIRHAKAISMPIHADTSTARHIRDAACGQATAL